MIVHQRLPFPHVVLMPNFGTLPSAWISPRDVGGALGLEVKKKLLLRLRKRQLKRPPLLKKKQRLRRQTRNKGKIPWHIRKQVVVHGTVATQQVAALV